MIGQLSNVSQLYSLYNLDIMGCTVFFLEVRGFLSDHKGYQNSLFQSRLCVMNDLNSEIDYFWKKDFLIYISK